MRRFLGWVALSLVLLAILLPVVALTFSVQVYGRSMEPTLHDGDRIVSNILRRNDVKRFDLVQTAAGEGGIEVVKRVVGMPGDTVSIQGDPKSPRVLVRPSGSRETFLVENPAWPSRIGARTQSCCNDKGKAISEQQAREVTLPADTYWVLGDNWGESDDSRVFGFVRATDISATLSFRIRPVKSFGKLENDVRLVPAG